MVIFGDSCNAIGDVIIANAMWMLQSEEPHTTGEDKTYLVHDFSHCKKYNIAKPLLAEKHTDYASINFTKQISRKGLNILRGRVKHSSRKS